MVVERRCRRQQGVNRDVGARDVRFELHGAYCGGHGVPSYFKTHRMTSQPFEFVMPH